MFRWQSSRCRVGQGANLSRSTDSLVRRTGLTVMPLRQSETTLQAARLVESPHLNRLQTATSSLQAGGISTVELVLCGLVWLVTPGGSVLLSCYFSWRLSRQRASMFQKALSTNNAS